MAILKNKRNLSKYEYEHSFDVAYKHIGLCMNSVPKRHRKWINEPINKQLNKIYITIMELRTSYFPKGTRYESSLMLINEAIDGILGLQLYFYSFWNVMDHYDERQMKYWCDLFNYVLLLLRGMRNNNPLYTPNNCNEEIKMLYYKKEDIKKAVFLTNMSKLHNYTHKKIARAKQCYADRECDMLADFVNLAWHSCLEANKKIPTTKKEYEARRKHISTAISCLKKMEVPMKSLFNGMEYSENTLREWSTIFNDTLKSLYGIQKSDKKRFEDLV